MQTKKIYAGKYEITKNDSVYTILFDDVAIGKCQRWNMYNSNDEWIGSGDTKKECVNTIKRYF